MIVIPNRSSTISMTKKHFLAIVYSKRITYKKGKRGLIERSDSDREKEMDLIIEGHKPGVFKEHMGEVINYLNAVENTMVPISRIEFID